MKGAMKLSVMTVSLRNQIGIAFALMTIMPLLTFGYFLTVYVMPEAATRESVLLVIVLNMVLSFAGFTILRRLVRSLLAFRRYINAVAEGDVSSMLLLSSGPELSSITQSLDRIVQKLYNDRERLKNFSRQLETEVEERTAELQKTSEALKRELAMHKRMEEELKRQHEQLRQSRKQLRTLSERLRLLREEERTRLAHRIHDELGQMLTALKMDVSWLSKKLPVKESKMLERAKAMEAHIEGMITMVGGISMQLRPAVLDHLGLQAAMEWEVEEFKRRTEIKVKLLLDTEITVDEKQSTTIFRIFQELMTNIARHARATEVEIILREEAGQVVLEVRDNGRGITEEEISCPTSFGLTELRERCFAWGGEVRIRGVAGKGTTATVSLPIGTVGLKIEK